MGAPALAEKGRTITIGRSAGRSPRTGAEDVAGDEAVCRVRDDTECTRMFNLRFVRRLSDKLVDESYRLRQWASKILDILGSYIKLLLGIDLS